MGALVFMHLPKTGGTTLLRIIARNYEPDSVFDASRLSVLKAIEELRRLPPRRRRKVKAFMGHLASMGYALRDYLAPPVSYITLLRDPIERVISHYFHILRHPAHPDHAKALSTHLSLKDCVAKGVILDNQQTRDISAQYPDFGRCDPGMLEAAKKNLRGRFAAFGLTERFDESVVGFQLALGWESACYRKVNVAPPRPKRSDLPKGVLKTIEEHNALDLELYRHARGEFDRRIREWGSRFQRGLKIFRFLQSHVRPPIATAR